ncbi:hypothetical protein AVEN_199412-1 [Araneus ventricosus]|uniref:Uncharacterized protein n=1 Tax=Araneus ventricosus TaxID=182803 RepID=A0A4Y2KC53_ARAVE|nr:hypothetical protein AVEN_199412-1 [Araneus ventricosus]
MSCCRISEQELASPGGIVMVELWVPPPVIVPGGVRPWPGDWLLGLRPQYSSYYSSCHSDDPDAWAVLGQLTLSAAKKLNCLNSVSCLERRKLERGRETTGFLSRGGAIYVVLVELETLDVWLKVDAGEKITKPPVES